MIIDRFQQQPRECRLRRIDYAEFLGAHDTLHAEDLPVVEVARLRGTADDAETPFEVGNLTRVDDHTISYSAGGGAHGNTYLVTFMTKTTNGQLHECEIEFKIREYGTAQGPSPTGTACNPEPLV